MGLFSLQPNEARVLVLFGDYRGTVRDDGFHWANPFYSNGASIVTSTAGDQGAAKSGEKGGAKSPKTGLPRFKISLRARTLLGDRLKVNDKRGNPIEIAAVVVWRVADTAQAVFDVDDYETYVEIQSEIGAAARGHRLRLRPRRGGRDHPAEQRRRGVRGAAQGTRSSGWPRPAWWSRRPGSPTSPTLRRSPRRCCAASRRRR